MWMTELSWSWGRSTAAIASEPLADLAQSNFEVSSVLCFIAFTRAAITSLRFGDDRVGLVFEEARQLSLHQSPRWSWPNSNFDLPCRRALLAIIPAGGPCWQSSHESYKRGKEFGIWFRDREGVLHMKNIHCALSHWWQSWAHARKGCTTKKFNQYPCCRHVVYFCRCCSLLSLFNLYTRWSLLQQVMGLYAVAL